ncbi:MAG: CpsD/CapB family tyrosine-protein kinase [Syntrophobacteraceae bacterium]|nr:CpsD/CapB family tyrosine-protein kinase [Syntrophobacteraceae bacterium]
MSKIFEALENAREMKINRKIELPLAPVSFATPVPAAFGLQDEMLRLSKVLERLLSQSKSPMVQFLGANGGEGTSTIAREFARVSSDLIGHSVLLLDADRHRPSQDRYFRLQNRIGRLDALKDEGFSQSLFHRIGQSRLFVSPCYNTSFSTPEIFDSRFENLCCDLRREFDMVVIDSAPLTISPDGLAIASKVDGVVLVVEADKTGYETVLGIKDNIARVGGNVLGVILNKRRHHIPKSIYNRL